MDIITKREEKRMKKFALVLVLAMALLMTAACGKECDLCGEKGRGETKEVLGKEVFICKECLDKQKDLSNAIGNLFN